MNSIQDRVRGARTQRSSVEIIIKVPHAGLNGSSEPADLAMMADGEAIAASTARRLCCYAGVVVAHVDAQGTPLSIGRKTSTILAAIKRALLLRDRACRFPGCTHRRFVDGHHIAHWADRGATALSNLMLLCSAHHTLPHEGGCRVEASGANGWKISTTATGSSTRNRLAQRRTNLFGVTRGGRACGQHQGVRRW